MREAGHDLGVAFDGDGDRMLAVDADGNAVDGDQILAILALHLDVDVVAVTVMTNLGFHRLMQQRGVRVVTTAVGDRYVLEALRRENGILGGEQSGHVICLRDHVTGDGLAAALLLCDAVRGRTLADAAAVMPRYAQAKENVRVSRREVPEAALAEAERSNAELDGSGRALVRASGTEPLIRVLGEAETPQEAQEICARIASLVQRSPADPRRLRVVRRALMRSCRGSRRRRGPMCGIIGYVGPRECKQLLLEGLERLEYRGYDSAGIALREADGLEYVRAVGNLQNLKVAGPERLHVEPRARPHALGHARWRHRGERPPARRLRRHEDVDRPERDRRELP